jgi:hypothetical protein
MNPKHVINNESTSALFFRGDAVKMSRMSMSWCLERSGIWGEVRGEVSMSVLHVSIHQQWMAEI